MQRNGNLPYDTREEEKYRGQIELLNRDRRNITQINRIKRRAILDSNVPNFRGPPPAAGHQWDGGDCAPVSP